jgi:hypothetical protein
MLNELSTWTRVSCISCRHAASAVTAKHRLQALLANTCMNTTDPAALTACLAVLQVVHCLALAADMSGDSAGAIRWLEVLTSLVPHDPGVLCKLGAIYHRLDAAPYGLLPLQALCDVAPFMLHARGACIERLRWCSPAGVNTLSSVGVIAAGPCALTSWRSLSRELHT